MGALITKSIAKRLLQPHTWSDICFHIKSPSDLLTLNIIWRHKQSRISTLLFTSFHAHQLQRKYICLSFYLLCARSSSTRWASGLQWVWINTVMTCSLVIILWEWIVTSDPFHITHCHLSISSSFKVRDVPLTVWFIPTLCADPKPVGSKCISFWWWGEL